MNWLAQTRLSAWSQPPLDLRIISFNIRYATSEPFKNEQPWVTRAPLVLGQLEHEVRYIVVPSSTADETNSRHQNHDLGAFICLQEVLHTQLVDLMAGLNHVSDGISDGSPLQGPFWNYVGVGRDDGKTAGEYSPIIYPRQIFRLLHNQTVWLSPTPSRPSKGWDAASVRILNVSLFQHRTTRRKVIIANTHLDDQGAVSRRESIKLILATLTQLYNQWSQDGQEEIGMFLAGDFNSRPDGEAYQRMNNSGYLTDMYGAVGEGRKYGNEFTFTGFEPEKNPNGRGRIDFIWAGPNEKSGSFTNAFSKSLRLQSTLASVWKALGYSVLPNMFDDEIYLSDHRAVVVDAIVGT